MARKAVDSVEKDRQNFIRQRKQVWKPGGYGATVEVWADKGKLKIRWTKPRRKQKTYYHEDTEENRRALTEIARSLVVKIQHPTQNSRPRATRGRIKVRDVWLYYLRDKWQDLPDKVIRGGRREVREYYEALAPGVRRRVPSARYLLSTIQAMRRITAYESYRPDRKIDTLQPIDWDRYTTWRLSQPIPHGGGRFYGEETVATDFGRFRAAIRHCAGKRPDWWGRSRDPLAGVKVIKSEMRKTPELGEDGATQLLTEIRKHLATRWRAYAALAIGMETGRRISEIGPDTLGFDCDTLCANDFHRDDTGRLHVTFRAATLKGRGFNRGDITIPATRGLETIYRWLTRYHANPYGPGAPLLWSPADPREPISYTAVRSAYVEAWQALHDGEEPPRGQAFHAVCYTVITTLVDLLGLEKTAEFVGRSTGTVERIYKRVRPETQIATADALDAARGRRRPRQAV